jgi:flagellar hook-associated protein 2
MINGIASSLGAGSGIDTARIVQDLAEASRAPKAEQFGVRAEAIRAKISAVAQARSDLDSFVSSLRDLIAGGTLQTQPTPSDPSMLSATAAPGTRIGSATRDIEISQLARAQTLYSQTVGAAADPVGLGTLTLSVGGQSHAIVIDTSNNSLSGLAAAINATGSGVQASVARDGAGMRLILKGASGAANAFTVEASAGSEAALSRFTHAGGAGGLIVGQTAQDAEFRVDGVAYSRASNTVNDVIDGITLSFKKAEPGTIVTLGATPPVEALRQTINDFVSVFNTLKRDIATAITATGGDAALRALDRQLSALIGQPLTSHPDIDGLSRIGIKTARDGTISLDTGRLEAVLRSNPQEVEALFSPTRDATHSETTDPGIGLALGRVRDAMTAGNGPLEALRQRLEKEAQQVEKNRVRMEEREAAYRSRLERQFGQMDARIAAIKATQSYLEQQIKLWTRDT